MNRHERRVLKAKGDTMVKGSGDDAMQKRMALVREHAQVLGEAWASRDLDQCPDPVLIVVDTDDVVGRRFLARYPDRGRVLVGLTSASELGTQLLDVEPDVYAKVQNVDTSRPYIVCIAHWGTTAGRPEGFGLEHTPGASA